MDVAAACVGVSAQGVEGGFGEEFVPLLDGEAGLASGNGGEEARIGGVFGGVFWEWLIDGHGNAFRVCMLGNCRSYYGW